MKKRKDRKSQAWLPIPAGISEEGLYQELVRRHPQYRRALERGETMMEGGEEVNPQMHLQMHLVVEKQIRGGDPDFVAEAALRLERAGVHPHEVRHLLALPVVYQAFAVAKEGRSYGQDEHRLAIEQILLEHLPQRLSPIRGDKPRPN